MVFPRVILAGAQENEVNEKLVAGTTASIALADEEPSAAVIVADC
ncbi:MAG: hypothetical protein ACKV22_19115 [Bryobacteraceae bacterium]